MGCNYDVVYNVVAVDNDVVYDDFVGVIATVKVVVF